MPLVEPSYVAIDPFLIQQKKISSRNLFAPACPRQNQPVAQSSALQPLVKVRSVLPHRAFVALGIHVVVSIVGMPVGIDSQILIQGAVCVLVLDLGIGPIRLRPHRQLPIVGLEELFAVLSLAINETMISQGPTL